VRVPPIGLGSGASRRCRPKARRRPASRHGPPVSSGGRRSRRCPRGAAPSLQGGSGSAGRWSPVRRAAVGGFVRPGAGRAPRRAPAREPGPLRRPDPTARTDGEEKERRGRGGRTARGGARSAASGGPSAGDLGWVGTGWPSDALVPGGGCSSATVWRECFGSRLVPLRTCERLAAYS
jgi:hypothetical protein